MTISVDIEGMPDLKWEDLWPRTAHYGEAHGYCGSDVIVCVTRVFSKDEDTLFHWVDQQDDCTLFGIQHLDDGRDLIVFNRNHTKQSREAADMEHRSHLRALIRRLESKRPLYPGERNMALPTR